MKSLVMGVVAMTMLASGSAHAGNSPKDEAEIRTIVESVGLLADSGLFESLEGLYSDEVKMDYTSSQVERWT